MPLSAAIALGALLAASTGGDAHRRRGRDRGGGPSGRHSFPGAMRDLMIGMHRNMPNGDTDKGLVALMTNDAKAAIKMATAKLQYERDAELKAVARYIVNSQGRAIAMVRAWHHKRGK